MRCPYCKEQLQQSPDGPWCPHHDVIDPADIELCEFEATHYVWFDENDEPRLGEGWAGFYANAVQLSDAALAAALGQEQEE
jgi:hypothetical protein